MLTYLAVKNSNALATTVPSRNLNSKVPFGIRKWMYNLSGYNQYGLYKDDCVVEDPIVTEAIRRLPAQIQDERNFRIARACQLSLMKTVLPKDQWPSYEEDIEKGRYLKLCWMKFKENTTNRKNGIRSNFNCTCR